MLATLVADAERSGVQPLGTPGLARTGSLPPRVGATPVATSEGEASSAGDGGGVTPVPRVGVVVGTTPVPVVTATPAAHIPYVYELAPCAEDFREMLARDRGLVGRWFEMHPRTRATMLEERHNEFDVDYLNELNVGFEASRPDCVAAGWDPEFSYGAECEGKTFRGVDITNGDLFGAYQGDTAAGSPREGEFVWHPTRQRTDHLLIQFSKMPMSDGAGCWAGNIVSGRWGWQSADGSRHGGIFPASRVCNANLILRAEGLLAGGWEDAEWLIGVEDYMRANRELCPRARLYPVLEAHEGCAEQAGLGPFEGGLVLHWNPRKVITGMPVCWVGRVDPNDGGYVWSAYDHAGVQVALPVPGS